MIATGTYDCPVYPEMLRYRWQGLSTDTVIPCGSLGPLLSKMARTLPKVYILNHDEYQKYFWGILSTTGLVAEEKRGQNPLNNGIGCIYKTDLIDVLDKNYVDKSKPLCRIDLVETFLLRAFTRLRDIGYLSYLDDAAPLLKTFKVTV